MRYFCEHKITLKQNLYEHKNEINCILENLGCNLPFDHAVSLSVCGSIVRAAIIPKNVAAHTLARTLDCVYWSAIREF